MHLCQERVAVKVIVQEVIVGGKETQAANVSDEKVKHRISDGVAVKGARPAAQLIQDHQGVWCGAL